MAGSATWLLPAPEPRFARDLPTIPPLPFRRGEGWGEGSVLALGFSGRGIHWGLLSPALSSLRGRRGRSRRVSTGNFLNSTAVLPAPILQRRRGIRRRGQ